MKWIRDFPEGSLGPLAGRKLVFEGSLNHESYLVMKVELRLYLQEQHRELKSSITGKQKSLITVVVETNKGTIEMKYLEVQNGTKELQASAELLSKYVGISSLVNRAILELLSAEQDKNET